MYQKQDIIEREIQRIILSLAYMLGLILPIEILDTKVTEELEAQLDDELDINVEKLLSLKTEALKEYITKKNYTEQHIEKLADILSAIGKRIINNEIKQKQYILQAIVLYQYAEQKSGIYSFSRNEKLKELTNQQL